MKAESHNAKKSGFSCGDIVQLRSGGPNMVVRETAKGQVTCRWFSGEALKEKSFYVEELTAAGQDFVERLRRAPRKSGSAQHRGKIQVRSGSALGLRG